MVGLVFAETLQLTFPQWVAVGLNTAGWLYYYCTSDSAGIQPANPPLRGVGGCLPLLVGLRGEFFRQWMLTMLLTFSGLWVAFWNTCTSIDQQVLFEQARYLSRFDWTTFLEEFGFRPYVEYQPPFVTFWVSRIPTLWLHQLILLLFGLLCVGLMRELYGRQAALLCAAPVFALMIHQPSTDTILFGILLIVLRLRQLSRSGKGVQKRSFCCQSFALTLLAAFFYGLTWMIKPLTLLTVPFIVPQLGIAGIGSLTMWGGYIWWSRHWEFGHCQSRFLLQQLFITRMISPTRKTTRPALRRSRLIRLWFTFLWRWKHLGCKAVMVLPFYLFPTWLRPWTWKGILLAMIIVFGYGNSKYLLLDLLFLLPVNEESAYS